MASSEWTPCGTGLIASQYETHWRVLESDPCYFVVRRVGAPDHTFEKRADVLADFLVASGATQEELRPDLSWYLEDEDDKDMGGLFD